MPMLEVIAPVALMLALTAGGLQAGAQTQAGAASKP